MLPAPLKEALTIAIADPAELFRKGLARTLNANEDLDIIWDTDNGAGLQHNILLRQPKILIMELRLKGMCGFFLLDWLQLNYPDVQVVILTQYETELTQLRLLRSGARAILKKDSPEQYLFHAITGVIEAGFFCTNTVSRSIFNYLYNQRARAGSSQKSQPCFTEREWEFLKLSSTDLTYEQIAFKLNIRTPTLNKLRNRLFENLEIANRSSLASLALAHGIS